MAPAGLSNGIVDSLMKASPSVLYLMFGRRSILSSATMWETILYPPLFSRVIDMGLLFLFNWQTKNISPSQKLAAYPHLYSFTSTKSVVHWFQIIRNASFQLYDDDVHQPMSVTTSHKFSKVAKYPTRNIRTPVVLVYGGSDSLVDIKAMLRELPPQTVATEIPHYEHLDFLWARDVDAQVFQHVFDALDSFTDAEHTAEEYDKYYLVRNESLMGSAYSSLAFPGGPAAHAQYYHHRGSESDASVTGGADAPVPQPHRAREPPTNRSRAATVSGAGTNLTASPHSTKDGFESVAKLEPITPPPSSDKLRGVGVRRGPSSTASSSGLNLEGIRAGRGISLGSGNAVSGVVSKGGGVERSEVISSSGDENKGRSKKKR